MSMGITLRVARLYSKLMFKGSAWLISSTHALTARHCVFTESLPAEELKLSFPVNGLSIRVRVVAVNVDLDVALLEVVAEDQCEDLDERVVRLARRPFLQSGLLVGVAGYPGNSLNNLAAAFRIDWRIIEVNQPLPDGGQDTIYAQLGGPSVSGATREDLKGLSGGPVWCLDDTDGDEPYAAGMMLRVPALDSIFIVPVARLLDWAQVVDDAYAQSPHRAVGPLCLELVGSSQIAWSALVLPPQSAELWGNSSGVTRVSCRATRKELGDDIFWALVRLIGHTDFDCSLRGVEDWKESMQVYGLQTQARMTECTGGTSKHRNIELSSKFQMITASLLAEEIHAALDQWVLNKMDNLLVGILNGSTPTHLDYHIDTDLSDTMLQIWRDIWHPVLESDAKLLRTMLVRLASYDEAAQTNGPTLAYVGKGLGPEYRMLWEPCLFALAIASSGIELAPSTLPRGNLTLIAGGAEGHACGCEKVKNQRISISLPKSPAWRTALVLLPLLKEGFLGIYRAAQPMNQGTGGLPRIGDPGLPPVIVSSDSTFLVALSRGKAEVCAHVQGLQDELAQIVKARFGEEEAEKWKQRLKF